MYFGMYKVKYYSFELEKALNSNFNYNICPGLLTNDFVIRVWFCNLAKSQ